MKNRRFRLANIVAIGVALAVAVGSVWYREAVGRNPIASLGGLIGLICYLLFQVFYDAQSEVANAAVHARIDMQATRIGLLERRLADIESDDTPPHGTPTLEDPGP